MQDGCLAAVIFGAYRVNLILTVAHVTAAEGTPRFKPIRRPVDPGADGSRFFSIAIASRRHLQ